MSNNFRERIDLAAESEAVVFHRFMLNIGAGDDSFHAFFEGKEDVSYYRPYLSGFVDCPSHIFPYLCGNKRSVLAIRDRVSSKLVKKGFFVDRDLDEFISTELFDYKSVYVTEGYSFESYFSGSGRAMSVIESLFSCSISMSDRHEFEGLYEGASLIFEDLARYIMAWWIFNISSGRKVNFSNFDISDVYIFDDSVVFNNKYDKLNLVKYLDKKCNVETPFLWFGVDEMVLDFLRPIPSQRLLKGKFVMAFFYDFIVSLSEFWRRNGKLGRRLGMSRDQFSVASASSIGYPRPLRDYVANCMV